LIHGREGARDARGRVSCMGWMMDEYACGCREWGQQPGMRRKAEGGLFPHPQPRPVQTREGEMARRRFRFALCVHGKTPRRSDHEETDDGTTAAEREGNDATAQPASPLIPLPVSCFAFAVAVAVVARPSLIHPHRCLLPAFSCTKPWSRSPPKNACARTREGGGASRSHRALGQQNNESVNPTIHQHHNIPP